MRSDGKEIIRADTICRSLGSSHYQFTLQLISHVSLAEGNMSNIIITIHLYLTKKTDDI